MSHDGIAHSFPGAPRCFPSASIVRANAAWRAVLFRRVTQLVGNPEGVSSALGPTDQHTVQPMSSYCPRTGR